MPQSTDWITLNVGGHVFHTSRNTLTSCSSFFQTMLSHETKMSLVTDDKKNIWIDRDGTHFSLLLSFMRSGRCTLPSPCHDVGSWKGLLQEVRYYCLDNMEAYMKHKYPLYFHIEAMRHHHREANNEFLSQLTCIVNHMFAENKTFSTFVVVNDETSMNDRILDYTTISCESSFLGEEISFSTFVLSSTTVYDLVTHPWWSIWNERYTIRGYHITRHNEKGDDNRYQPIMTSLKTYFSQKDFIICSISLENMDFYSYSQSSTRIHTESCDTHECSD